MSGKGEKGKSSLPPGVEWLAVEKVFAYLQNTIRPTQKTETLSISAASGRVLAKPLVGMRAHPPLANSAVDGYGFAHASLTGGARRVTAPFRLKLMEVRAAAGEPFEGNVPAGFGVRVLTGAPLPRGVDTVILQEKVSFRGGDVLFDSPPKRGANIREAGEDVQKGAVLFQAGHVLRPQDIALGVGAGVVEVSVFRRLKIAICATGNELVKIGQNAKPHQIFDANRPMLIAMVEKWGHEALDLGVLKDDAHATENMLNHATEKADIVITTGGASTGDEDHIGALLSQKGASSVWRVALKPGRPLAIAEWRGKLAFGLPGNPVAGFVCALIFVKPALEMLSGAGWSRPCPLLLPAGFHKQKGAGRREYLRARLFPNGTVERFASEGSGRVSGLSWAGGLVELPDDACTITPGDLVRFFPFSAFGL